MKYLKLSFLSSLLLILLVQSAQTQEHTLPSFDKIKVSPHIALIMKYGPEESVRFIMDDIADDALNFEVRNGTLYIYLDGARNTSKQRRIVTPYGKVRESIYADGRVTAFVTYRQLNKLIVKGDENVRVEGNITDETFKLKAYGDSDITFEELNTDRLKVKMYGDCRFTVGAGNADRQKYTLFGDHLIDTRDFAGQKVKATSMGDTEFRMNGDRLKITALGEVDINCPSSTQLRKFVIGESSVRRY